MQASSRFTDVVPQVTAGDTGLARRTVLGALLVPGALAGCSINGDEDHRGEHAPSAAPLPRAPRMAWVFSSGGPRGFVHVGVLKALAELKLAPDLIVGTSVGALVGALRAGGLPALELEATALELQPWRLARLHAGGNERLSGSAIAEFVRERLAGRTLDQLPLAMACVAQRLGDGSVVAFTRGDAGLAVQASSAIEGRFVPVRIRGQRYVDADLYMPLPVRVARALGARRVLAVDASAHEDRPPPGAERYRESDLRKRALTRPDAQSADLLLHPEFGYWVSLSREFRQRAIDAGYRAALAAGDRLRALHAV